MLKNDQTLQDFHFLYRIMYHMLGNFSAPCMKGLIVWIILLQNLFTLFFILTQTSVLINLANSKIIWLSNDRERSMSFQWQSTLKFPKTSLKSRKLLFLNKKMIPSELSVLRKKCPYSELFWSAFVPHSGSISSYSVRIRDKICRQNRDQNNSEYGHFLRSVIKFCYIAWCINRLPIKILEKRKSSKWQSSFFNGRFFVNG